MKIATVLTALGFLFGFQSQSEPITVAGTVPVHQGVTYSKKDINAMIKREAMENPSPSNSRAYARTQIRDRQQFSCVGKLWGKESAWKHRADNPYSSAYGIPQAMPGNKMEASGKDWRTNPVTQIDWGIKYIKVRYGSPCQAWSFFQKNHWY